MKKLLSKFQSLPPEVRMLIAMAGLGTPIGIVWFLSRYLHLPMMVVVLGLAGVLLFGGLIVAVIARLFSRAARKRQRKMESELASGAAAGPVSMDLRAAIKSNTEKFFTAIKDMRKQGISVYDLPWYVVIGDSGCGKTKLINEGGLTFSTGKPEGYQLGTLNYNWWFTEDACFIDMAGRLCNPKDDTDYREWDAFLKSVQGGRRGYPVNGVLACISAEHLLQDPPEKHEADANTMLERLRDLQSKLGVTFATYLVITKCDKILGFMPFFDRAERDISIKNQIFGWSKAGSFSELVDPEQFGGEFDTVYGRLNELRLRRLNDDVDEQELGLAYSYPEEFRALKDPLQTYMRTLFPMIKSPRVVKNLIFRGIYFTSATQQGGLILRRLAERLGEDAASQFAPLESLYPRPRPHFVRDLLFRKVFPEQGLVFRNEQDVVRHKKLARVFTIGTAVLAVLLLTLLFFGAYEFGQVISGPRTRATTATDPKETVWTRPVPALALTGQLGGDAKRLSGSVWASVLSLGIGTDTPVRHLSRIQMWLFEEAVLPQVLDEVEKSLGTAPIVADAEPTKEGAKDAGPRGIPFKTYLAALEAYVSWTSCAGQSTRPADITADSFDKLCAVVPPAAPLWSAVREAIDKRKKEEPGYSGPATPEAYLREELALRYFSPVAAPSENPNPNPARLLSSRSGVGTVRTAIAHLHQYLEGYARLDEKNLDPTIREWMHIARQCQTVETSYKGLLGAGKDIQTREAMQAFKTSFGTDLTAFSDALAGCAWRGKAEGSSGVRIEPLVAAIERVRLRWVECETTLDKAGKKCSGADPAITQAIIGLRRGDPAASLAGLDRVLWKSLQDAELTTFDFSEDIFTGSLAEHVKEVHVRFNQIIDLKTAEPPNSDAVVLGKGVDAVQKILKQIGERLSNANFDVPEDLSGETAASWVSRLEARLYPEEVPAPPALPADLGTSWRADELRNLYARHEDLIGRAEGTALLATIRERLTQPDEWGFAELDLKWRDPATSAYKIPMPSAAGPRAPVKPTPAEPAQPQAQPQKRVPPPRLGGGKPAATEKPATPTREPTPPPRGPAGREGGGDVPRCATADFLNQRAGECIYLLSYLAQFKAGSGAYFASEQAATPLNEQCRQAVHTAWQHYVERYVKEWSEAYGKKRLESLEGLTQDKPDWRTAAGQLDLVQTRDQIGEDYERGLSEILQHTCWALYLHPAPELGPGWLEKRDDFSNEKQKVGSALRAAFANKDLWKHGAFVSNAKPPAAGTDLPWVAVARSMRDKWVNLAKAIAAVKDPLLRFPDPQPPPPYPKIVWGALNKAMNEEYRLDGEELTKRLVTFEADRQERLSELLTSIYTGIQDARIAAKNPYDGWPYLNKEAPDQLETVDFPLFKEFLLEAWRADSVLGPLEEGLPKAEKRQAFVKQAKAWYEFLVLAASGAAKPLEGVQIEKPSSNAAQFYKTIRLNFGFKNIRLKDPGSGTGKKDDDRGYRLEFGARADDARRRYEADWYWEQPQLDEQADSLTFAWVDGITPEGEKYTYPNIPKPLGKPSPLAFCAYLHRHGQDVNKDGKWEVTHQVNLLDEFKGRGDEDDLKKKIPQNEAVIWAKFIFTLPSGRNLPAPIAPLRPSAGTPATAPGRPPAGGS